MIKNIGFFCITMLSFGMICTLPGSAAAVEPLVTELRIDVCACECVTPEGTGQVEYEWDPAYGVRCQRPAINGQPCSYTDDEGNTHTGTRENCSRSDLPGATDSLDQFLLDYIGYEVEGISAAN